MKAADWWFAGPLGFVLVWSAAIAIAGFVALWAGP